MAGNRWYETFPAAIMVTDKNGVIINMNEQSVVNYKKNGGLELIGTSAITCHKGPSLKKIEDLFKSQKANTYFITKNKKKKLVYQAPYFEDGVFAGMVELSVPLPDDIPHYDRDAQKK
jgi:hypothetical protein